MPHTPPTAKPILPHNKQSLTRRGFLKLSGAIASLGLAAVSLEQKPVAAVAPSRASLRLGVLLPQALSQPTASAIWLRELQRALPATLHSAIAGGNLTGLQQATDTLLAQQIRLMIGLVDPRLALQIAPNLADQEVKLVSADFGARVNEGSPNHLETVSLYQWQANWAFGRWQAQHVGRRGFMVMSMHESGYDTPFAFQSGFESAGGEIVGTLVPDAPVAPQSMTEVMARIRNARPDAVYVLLQDVAAGEFVAAYRQAGLLHRVPMSGSPFVMAAAMHTLGVDAIGMRSWRTWRNANDGPLVALAQRTAKHVLTGSTTDGASIYVSEVRVQDGQPYIDSVAQLGQTKAVQPLVFTGPRTGWMNPYL